MKRTLTIAFGLLLAATALAKMEFHQDETADFSTFHTYRWTQGAPAGKGGVEKQIKQSVDTQLGNVGLTRVDDDSADLDVATYVLTDTNIDIWSDFVTGQWGMAMSVQVRDITDAKLILRITRSGTQDMVWHVMEHEVVEPGQTSTQLERKVDRIIQKMFKNYPRPSKS